MRGPTRLAGAGPLDGRVRRRSMHSLHLNSGAPGAACKGPLASSERQRASHLRASREATTWIGARRQRACKDERARIQASQSPGFERSAVDEAGTALNLIGFKVSEPCAGRQRTDGPHEPPACAKRREQTAAFRRQDVLGKSSHSTSGRLCAA